MIIQQHHIYRSDLRSNRSVVYLFGDNELRVGMGGQAGEMRGEPNAIGIATMASPDRYWNEDDTQRQVKVIDADLWQVLLMMSGGYSVVIPSDGLGTGLARLEEHAPTTFGHLQARLNQLMLLRNYKYVDQVWKFLIGPSPKEALTQGALSQVYFMARDPSLVRHGR